jgi:hypothetical protein
MSAAITMRELQKMSARAIQALPHAVPVKNGRTTVALLVPVQKAPRELVDRVLARIDAAAQARSPEETARLERLLGENDSA